MNLHFIAIGGSAMHSLAIAMHRLGHKVSGSDDVIFEPEVNVNNGQWTLWNPIPKIWALGVNLSF